MIQAGCVSGSDGDDELAERIGLKQEAQLSQITLPGFIVFRNAMKDKLLVANMTFKGHSMSSAINWFDRSRE